MTERHPGLERFEVLVGTWNVTGHVDGPEGEIQGQVRFEWYPGGHFLVQHADLVHLGHVVHGIEYIGYGRDYAGAVPKDCTSHLFDADGNHFIYVWELEGSELTIWGGEIGSPAYYKGTFSANWNVLTGAWVWPGGGYSSTSTRVSTRMT